jgi:phage/plasmid-associated DNA primase
VQKQDYTSSSDFLKRVFGDTLHNVELRACYNEKGIGGIAPAFTRDGQEIEDFCERHDGSAEAKGGVGVYFGCCTRQQGVTSGNLQTVAECPILWVDIDCAKQGLGGEETINTLRNLPCPPSIIVNSGGGLHGYWVLEEPLELAEEESRTAIYGALRKLALILAGDTSCADLARIMRLPGTHNTKAATKALNDGTPALCEILFDTGQVYDFDDIVEWLAEQRVMLHGKAPAAQQRPVNDNDPFVAYAREAGFNPAIDIDAELAAMVHGAGGRNSIHATQLRVSASMIARGYDDDEIVDRIIAATEAAAPGTERWNWAREEKAIRDMIRTGRNKGYKKEKPSPAPMPQAHGNTALKLVHDADADEQPKSAKAVKESKSATVAVGKAAIGVWRDRHGPVMHTGGQTYAYEAGVWSLWDDRHAQRLRTIIQEACAAIGVEPKTSLLGAAKAYFMDRPELARFDIEFDNHGLLVAKDACLDLRTFEVVDHSPEHFATRKVAATLSGSRNRETLEEFLKGTFADRPEATDIISTLQEWFGAAIMPLNMKHRGQKKGLFAHGPSRSGKTQISELVRFLLGHTMVCGAPMRGLEDRFSTEPLIGKYGWIADDAVGEGEYLDADIYKVVVTGEQTSTKTKGGKNWEGRFGIPVLLTANNLPRVKDQSDAVYNRSLILPMTNVRPENAPEPAGFESIADKIGKTELTGLLWWAIEGWQRLAARGTFDPPLIMLEANKALKDENNPVDAWRRECMELCPDGKVLRADLLASMNGWSSQEYGVDAKPWSGRGFFPRLVKMIPGYSKEHSETADVDGNRLLIGVKLNKAGLRAWRVHKDSRWGEGAKTSTDETFVNKDHAQARMSAAAAPSDRRPRF